MAMICRFVRRVALGGALLALPAASGAQRPVVREAEVRQAVRSFWDALAEGDSVAALALLRDDAVIFEAGPRRDEGAISQWAPGC